MSNRWKTYSNIGLANWQELRRIVYERVEVSSVRKPVKHGVGETYRSFKALGNVFTLGRNVFKASNRLVLELRLRSTDTEKKGSEARMLRGLFSTGFEGMFAVSYEPFNYEVRFSIVSKFLRELNMGFSRLRASILAGYPGSELEVLKASRENVLWPLGGVPASTYRNTILVSRGLQISAISFLSMRLEDNSLTLEDGLGDALRSSAESGCSLRLCIPMKPCKGVLHSLKMFTEKRSISTRYSRLYRKLREDGLFSNRDRLMGIDPGKSSELEKLLLKYETLSSQAGCWECSPTIVVIGPPQKDLRKAYSEQRRFVESVKAAFSSSYGVKFEESGWLSFRDIARSILGRRLGSSRLHLASRELSLFVNLPEPITPSLSYVPKRVVEFNAFDPSLLMRKGILLGWYESLGRRMEVRIGLNDLPLSLAIFGVPGSGKTTLAKNLLKRYEELGGVAMVFDRHREYLDEFEDALILNTESTGINPLEHHGNPESHAKTLSEVFAMTWPDEFGPLVSHVFRTMYLDYVRKTSRPELKDFILFLEDSMVSEKWVFLRSGKARDRLFSLIGRLSELTVGAVGKVFDSTKVSAINLETLLSKNIVFDLTSFDTDRDANIFTWLMLKQVYDYRRRKPNTGLPHIIMCEEAHNVAPASFEGQETIVEKMLREMRKFRESVWLIDQRPLTVSRDVLGLCGTMICLRLQYSSDVGKVSDTMHLNEEQAQRLQELEQGEAVALLPGISTAIPVILDGFTD